MSHKHGQWSEVFKNIILIAFKGPDGKKISRKVQNTNGYKYKGPPDH